jgi:hypothetical protein
MVVNDSHPLTGRIALVAGEVAALARRLDDELGRLDLLKICP